MASLIERRYRKGTNFVPSTGPAILEKGEAVITASANKKRKKKKKKKGAKPGQMSAMLSARFGKAK